MAEFTLKSILLGAMFGIIFGASTVYLALKAGLTVSASIPIAVLAISIGRKFFKTTILENNIIQTTGSAGESIASGVVFTLPAFLFLSVNESGISNGMQYFEYWTIFTLAVLGGMLGTLMMIPLRRSLIVKEHQTLPYPEGTA
ncbi:MAG TPA: OPT/YSL family transporter, partial [Bacteroidia bacterium]|nr:OPT/YSL family transporter [Bacteroidia bacterium]